MAQLHANSEQQATCINPPQAPHPVSTGSTIHAGP